MKISVNPDSAVPLHVQLLNQIRHLILSGEWPAGSRLPSEAALTRELLVSRGTIRHALKNAQVEGLVQRVPSKGTFVAPSPLRGALDRVIGYVTSDFLSDFQRQMLCGAEDLARARGYRLLFSTSSQEVSTENRLLEQMLVDQVSGILVWPIYEDDPSRALFRLAQRCETPVVFMDRSVPGLKCDHVTSDNYTGAYRATEHLIRIGHDRIVFLSRPLLRLSTIADRLRGYRQALRDAGLEPQEPWLIAASQKETGEQYTLRLYSSAATSFETEAVARRLRGPDRPTAIFAMNDLTALLAYKAAIQAGLAVPDDLSLVGFDDMDFVTLLPTPLTTVAQDAFALGRRAAELLVERVEGYGGPPRSELIPTQLKVRASTAPPQQSCEAEGTSGLRTGGP